MATETFPVIGDVSAIVKQFPVHLGRVGEFGARAQNINRAAVDYGGFDHEKIRIRVDVMDVFAD